MELLGKEYLIDHCTEEITKKNKHDAFMFYLSEIIRTLNNNVAHGIGGREFPKSFKDIMEQKPETRTGEEIKEHMMRKLQELGKEVNENGAINGTGS